MQTTENTNNIIVEEKPPTPPLTIQQTEGNTQFISKSGRVKGNRSAELPKEEVSNAITF